MIQVETQSSDIAKLIAASKAAGRSAGRDYAVAINRTAKKVKSFAAKELSKVLTCKQKILKKAIATKGRATKERLSAKVRVWEGHPIPLKYFQATQTKRNGVTYRTHKQHNRKSILRDAFIVKQYADNVYRRTTSDRGPLEKIHGPSPGDAFAEAGLEAKVKVFATAELSRQITRQVRQIALVMNGTIKSKYA